MLYVILDKTSNYFLAVDPTPTISFLLRESHEHATKFEFRSNAEKKLKAALEVLKGKYTELDLVIRPASKSQKRQSTLRSNYDAGRDKDVSRKAKYDPADRINVLLAHNRKYDRDMS